MRRYCARIRKGKGTERTLCAVRLALSGAAIIIGHSMSGVLVQKLPELGQPRAVVPLAPAGPRWILAVRSFAAHVQYRLELPVNVE